MRSTDDIDFERALASPSSVFATPEAVLGDPRLDAEAKRAILASWERDARQLMVAQDESMAGGEPNLLQRVRNALRRLTEFVADKPAPSRQGRDVRAARAMSELMRPVIEVLHPDHDLDEASGRLRDSGHPVLVVVDGDEVVGIVDQAMIAAAPREPSPATGQAPTVKDVMSTEIAFCFHDENPERISALVARDGAPAVLVLDRSHRLAGIVPAGDLLGHAHTGARGLRRKRVGRSAGRAVEERPGRLRSYSVRPRLKMRPPPGSGPDSH